MDLKAASAAGKTGVSTKNFSILPVDRESGQEIVSWQYPDPYALYNIQPDEAKAAIEAFVDPQYKYFQVRNTEDKLVAFFTLGVDARVSGGDYSQDALDIGLGVRPDFTGRGLGSVFVRLALDYARKTEDPDCYRVTIAEFNLRARRVWEKAGFREVSRFSRPVDVMPFILLAAERSFLILS